MGTILVTKLETLFGFHLFLHSRALVVLWSCIICPGACHHRHNQDTEPPHHPKGTPSYSYSSCHSLPTTTSPGDQLFSTIFSFNEHYVHRIIQYITFWDLLFSLNRMLLRSKLLDISMISFLLLNSIPFYEWTIFFFPFICWRTFRLILAFGNSYLCFEKILLTTDWAIGQSE